MAERRVPVTHRRRIGGFAVEVSMGGPWKTVYRATGADAEDRAVLHSRKWSTPGVSVRIVPLLVLASRSVSHK